MNKLKWPAFGRVVLAVVFAGYATAKLLAGSEAQANTLGGMFGKTGWAAVVVLEFVLAAWLLAGRWPTRAALMTLAVLSLFSGLIVVELQKDVPRPCGCSGAATTTDPDAIRRNLRWALARNGGLMAVAVALVWAGPARDRRLVPVHSAGSLPLGPLAS